jgi:hypothetical protein|nr:MAG TPA: Gemin6 6 [Caudoviricetes sp.]
MVNIWDYANRLPRVKILTATGKSFEGKVIAVLDALESNDDQDNMVVEADSGEINVFYPEEIESIEVLDD